MTKTDNKSNYTRSLIVGAVAGLTLAVAFAAGFFVNDLVHIPSAHASGDTTADQAGYPLVDEVQRLLDDVYLREQPDYSVRQYGAIRGLLQTLDDPNTFFIEPPTAKSEADALAGTYGGVGVLVQRNAEGDFVLFPFGDSPAAEAGIEEGSVLIAINGERVDATMQQDAIDQMMRGEVGEGNGVELTVEQGGSPYTTFIEFEVINVPSVIWRLRSEDEAIGYIQILRFTNRTPNEVRTALTELRDLGISGLILDLRNNSGGLLEESIAVADEFLDSGVVVYETTANNERTYSAEPGGMATDIPLALLVNQQTASASELVAGAIRDRDRGVLIGQRTFGKGTVQQIFSLSDGSSIHITSAEWFTPARIPLDGVGLEPNIEVSADDTGRDIEVREAIQYLQETIDNERNSNQ